MIRQQDLLSMNITCINDVLKTFEEKQLSLLEKIEFLYGKDKASTILTSIKNLISEFVTRKGNMNINSSDWLDEKQVILITYGDLIYENNKPPLETLNEFLTSYANNSITGIHILPFYPYTSDDGFSVIDYQQVNPELGNWEHIKHLSKNYKLMFDFVLNHVSQSSKWFKEYLSGNPKYNNFFIEKDPSVDTSKVTRPRAWPWLHEYTTTTGEQKYLVTTFSKDQVDLNFKNEKVLLKMIEIFLDYISKGATLIRLDAVCYLWKEDGTSCVNLPQTHKAIQIFRDIIDICAPQTKIITEANVPHKDNIKYFGDDYNESHMIYNFALPPLVLNAFQKGNVKYLAEWAASLETENLNENFHLDQSEVSQKTTACCFFNFLSSHDGIGLMPVKDILSPEEIEEMVQTTLKNGGNVSLKNNGDGTRSPYELNINYLDGISKPDDSIDKKASRFIAAQALLLSFKGVPGIYIHSLVGSTNYYDKLNPSDPMTFRSINREKLNRKNIEEKLSKPDTLENLIFTGVTNLINIRKNEKAFHPYASQEIVKLNDSILSFVRTSLDGSERLITLINFTDSCQTVILNIKLFRLSDTSNLTDIISGVQLKIQNNYIQIKLAPYQTMWLK